ncbi:uncharacterized protein LOC135167157 [Diachasmimorpha longicaudata]|uniref:uncharacterized protein LOC135167157 n=1 Tax=Diachasmimorpha longicaudata TaxID=58733 RepID=UPI0030B8DAFE
MRLSTIVACVLVTCGPMLAAGQKKMIFVIPRTVRRAQTTPWRQFPRPPFPKFLSNEMPQSRGHSFPHPKFPPNTKSIFLNQNHPPTDNFDQSPVKVNHVVIPQGKGITHAFGNGYIPHEPINDPPGSPDSSGSPEQIEHNPLNYYSHPQVTQQTDNYLHHDEEGHQHDNQERRTDNQRGKYFFQKNIAKPFNKVVYGIPKKPYFSPESFQNKDKSILTAGGAAGGSKEPIVLRDGIDLSHYHKKLAELASTWPGGLHGSPAAALSTAVAHGTIPAGGGASQQLSGHFQPNAFGISFLSSNSGIEQPGYAVQEDVQEDTNHDFRTQPIQTAPAAHPSALQAAVPQLQFTISPDPFMPSLQFPAPQGYQGVPEHLQG